MGPTADPSMSNKDDTTLRGVQMLLSDDADWVIFKICLIMSIAALDALGHLNRSDIKSAGPTFTN